MAGQVQHLDPPVVREPQRLAAAEPLVDRGVFAARGEECFNVVRVEPVRGVPAVVLLDHRVAGLDPAAVELVAGEPRGGVQVEQRALAA